MRRFLPLIAVVLFVAGIFACDADPPDSIVPEASAATMGLEAQSADTFEVIATWRPVVFLGDTVREYVRDVERTDGAYSDSTKMQAIGSEVASIPSPPAGSTATYRYCLRSVAENEVGDTVVTPDSMASCRDFQYTAPTSLPPAPDSLEVDPSTTVFADSMTVYPGSVTLTAGDSVDLTAVVWRDEEIIGCSGSCDTVPVTAAEWRDGVPSYIAQRDGYPPDELFAKRLPWLRNLGTTSG